MEIICSDVNYCALSENLVWGTLLAAREELCAVLELQVLHLPPPPFFFAFSIPPLHSHRHSSQTCSVLPWETRVIDHVLCGWGLFSGRGAARPAFCTVLFPPPLPEWGILTIIQYVAPTVGRWVGLSVLCCIILYLE